MINISYETHPELYEDHKACLRFLSGVHPEDYEWPRGVTCFHQYSEVTNKKQLLAVESYFATQNQEHTKLVLWSDWDVRDNPLLAPYKDRIDFRVFDPVGLAKGTILEGKDDVLLADDMKHYMKSGLLRFLALYKEGGIWFDMDMVLLRDLRPILDQEFAYVWEREFLDFTQYGPCAAFMGIHRHSTHARVCIEELGRAPVIPNSVSRDCDMLKSVYTRRPFTVFPSAFFNTEWQMKEKTGIGLRAGWFVKTKESNDLFLDAFAWHWHGSGGTRSDEIVRAGSKFANITAVIRKKIAKEISFIFVARNDGYGNGIGAYPEDGEGDFNLKRIGTVLRALRYMNIPGAEVICFECFPPDDRPKLRDIFGDYARFITIPNEVQKIVYGQTPYRMPIYEFLSKHIGVLCAKSERLFFHNSDDIFRRIGIKRAIADIDAGLLVRADRLGVHPSVVNDDTVMRSYVDDETATGLDQGLGRYPGAGGDYCGIRKDLYFKSGGWRVAHGEWDLDAEYFRRCEACGIVRKQEDVFYHIEHYRRGVSQHKDTPNRPPRIKGEEHQLISDLDKIIGIVADFNSIGIARC
ncbi:MAG: glycosyltransferase [bacterium]